MVDAIVALVVTTIVLVFVEISNRVVPVLVCEYKSVTFRFGKKTHCDDSVSQRIWKRFARYSCT